MSEEFEIQNGELLKYHGTDESVLIPIGIRKIAAHAFENCEFIKSVTISDDVEEIGDSAFEHCTNLENVSFAKNGKLQVIGERAFCECAIEKLIFPPSVQQIRAEAFMPSGYLTKLILSPNLSYIGSSAFEGCEKLSEVFIPSSVKKIDSLAFAYASKMTAYAEAAEKPDDWSDVWNCDEFPCKVMWGQKPTEEKNDLPVNTKAENDLSAGVSNDQAEKDSPIFPNKPKKAKTGKTKKALIICVAVTGGIFLIGLILSLILNLKFEERFGNFFLIITGCIEIVFAVILLFVVDWRQRYICPECGTKRQHHREYVQTIEKGQMNVSKDARSMYGSGNATGWVKGVRTNYTIIYKDTYVCPKCGSVFHTKASEDGGYFIRYTNLVEDDHRKQPKEF